MITSRTSGTLHEILRSTPRLKVHPSQRLQATSLANARAGRRQKLGRAIRSERERLSAGILVVLFTGGWAREVPSAGGKDFFPLLLLFPLVVEWSRLPLVRSRGLADPRLEAGTVVCLSGAIDIAPRAVPCRIR